MPNLVQAGTAVMMVSFVPKVLRARVIEVISVKITNGCR